MSLSPLVSATDKTTLSAKKTHTAYPSAVSPLGETKTFIPSPLLGRGVILLLCVCSTFFFSCKKDKVLTDTSAKLSFSTDSVLFDTVFTTVGSTVRAFLVRNTHSQPIVISSIKLAGSYTSPFRINVDGAPGTSFSNVRIPAKDSIFVFVTCTLDPNNKNNPIVIEDSLVFTTNGNVQSVHLEAWGQDAHFFKPNIFPSSGPAYSIIPCSSSHWINDKPYVIFGYVVDTGCTLTIDAGVNVYLHNNGVLYINSGGTLLVQGAAGNPVTFQGDRLEPEYKYVPGQWGEIQLAPGSKNNVIQWAVIKNGTVGVEADTVANSNPTLEIDHTIIKSMTEFGLLGLGARITGDDLLIEDCQYYCVNLSYGGGYRFNQCTFANYWSYGQRQTGLLLLNNHYTDINGNNQVRKLDSANFYNSLIYGSQADEIAIDKSGSVTFNYFFGYCFLKTTMNITTANYTNCATTDPSFLNTNEPPSDNYHVSTASPARIRGNTVYGNTSSLLDLENNGRNNPSTLGAYEK